MITHSVEVRCGKTYLVTFVDQPRKAKVLEVIHQHGVVMIRYRIGLPVFGIYRLETSQQFWDRMVTR